MNKTILERYIVVFLFILVLVVFSFAERDTRKMDRLYAPAESYQPLPKQVPLAVSADKKHASAAHPQ